MKLGVFNGGLSTIVSPHLININESITCENIDLRTGSLTPLKADKDTLIDKDDSIYYFDSTWLDASNKRDYIEANDVLYWTDGAQPKFIEEGGSETNLGITQPTNIANYYVTLPFGNKYDTFPDGGTMYGYFHYDDGTTYSDIAVYKKSGETNPSIYSVLMSKDDPEYTGIVEYTASTTSESTQNLDDISIRYEQIDDTVIFGYHTDGSVDAISIDFINSEYTVTRLQYSGSDLKTNSIVVFNSKFIALKGYIYDTGTTISNVSSYDVLSSADGITWSTVEHTFTNVQTTGHIIEYSGDLYSGTTGIGSIYLYKLNSSATAFNTTPDKVAKWDFTEALDETYFYYILNVNYFNTDIVLTATRTKATDDKYFIGLKTTDLTSYIELGRFDNSNNTIDYLEPIDSNYWLLRKINDYPSIFSIGEDRQTTVLLGEEDTAIAQYESSNIFTSTFGLFCVYSYVTTDFTGYRIDVDAFSPIIYDYKITTVESFGESATYSDTTVDFAYTLGSGIRLPHNNTATTKELVYRIGGDVTDYYSVDTYETDILDVTGNGILDNTLLDDSIRTPPIATLQYLTQHKVRLFTAKDDKVYFSDLTNFNYWPSTYFIDFDTTVTGIASTPLGLLVFTSYKTFIVTGDSQDNFSSQLLSDSQGCASHRSVAYLNQNAIWASNDSLCVSNGGLIQTISINKIDMSTSTIEWAEVYKEKYYLVYSDKVLIYDITTNSIEYMTSTLVSLHKYNGLLYGSDGTNLLEINNDTTNKTLKYKSPVLVEGDYAMVKLYNNIYIYISGTLTLKAYIDGTLIDTYSLTNGANDIAIPQGKQRGYSIQFEVEGTGELFELEYKIQRRANGR